MIVRAYLLYEVKHGIKAVEVAICRIYTKFDGSEVWWLDCCKKFRL